MKQSIAIFDPSMRTGRTGRECKTPRGLRHVHCGGGKTPRGLRRVHCKGGGGGSSAEYERQLAEQRQAREKAEREAAELKQNQEATAAERKKRGQASFLTGGGGTGDDKMTTKKSYLGSGN